MPFYILCRLLRIRKSDVRVLSRSGDHGTKSEKMPVKLSSAFAREETSVFFNRDAF